MGCTPSIHVSQTGVIYCQDSDESPSSYTGSNQQFAGIPGRFKTDLESECPSANTQSVSSEMPAQSMGSAASPAPARPENTAWSPPQRENNEVRFGSFRFVYDPLKIMLVFSKEDSQSDGFWWAAEKLQYKSEMMCTLESAIECYLTKYHDIVIIDARHSKLLDAEKVCRSLRSQTGSQHSVMVAVVKKSVADKEDGMAVQLLAAGFNRWFLESPSLGVCLNELLQLEINEVRTQMQLKAAHALLAALNNCRDVVEITNGNHEIQYVNRAAERLLGYASEDLLGRPIHDVHKVDSMKADFLEAIHAKLQDGKEWEGTFLSRRKSGGTVPMPCKVVPVATRGTHPDHYVYVKEYSPLWDRSIAELPNGKDNSHISALDLYPYHRGSLRSIRKGSYDVKSLNNEVPGLMNRRQSVARIHAMTIDAPIMRVMSMISAAQENSPVYIAQTLDQVLDILRSTELYSPQLLNQQNCQDDPIAVDLLGGLLAQGPKIPLSARRQSEITFTKVHRPGSEPGTSPVRSDVLHSEMPEHHVAPIERRLRSRLSMGFLDTGQHNLHSSLSLPSLTSIPSSIKTLLENDSKWDFDVIELEKLTNKRPLVWLGMVTFARFGLASLLKCDEITIQNWLTLIEANYHSQNPYHNSTHAADVMHATAYFLDRDHIKQILDPMDEAACLIAAVVHDVDHPGKNSAFLCNSNNELAILYNDRSVLESHHSAMAFKLTHSDDRVNIFRNMEKDDYRCLRQSIIDMVLATEMTKHFEHLNKFVNSFTKQTFQEEDTASAEIPSEQIDLSSLATPENIVLVKRVLIKCADVSNPTRCLDLCIEWANRIADEYFRQTEEEKVKDLPVVMPMFDRTTCSIPKSQMSFMDYFINDMFDAWDAFADLPELMDNIRKNYQYWKDQEQKRCMQQDEERQKSEASTPAVTPQEDT